MSRDLIIALLTATASIISSVTGIKAIIKHERYMCDKRMEAFKEGLDRGEQRH